MNAHLTGRRQFSFLLATGLGLGVLSACTGGPPSSSASAGPPAPSRTVVSSPSTEPAPEVPPAATPTPSAAPAAGLPVQHSIADPESPWLVVNKSRPLAPADFRPTDLRAPLIATAATGEAALLNSTTAQAAEAMFAAAAADGVGLVLASGFRSFETQRATYEGFVSSRGQADADTASARPGYSEHQTGWSFDLTDDGGACGFQPCFADQPAAIWVAGNAARYGFIVRYPLMFHAITGYFYEPWHVRFIGSEAATAMRDGGIATLEEFLGLDAAPGYP